MRAVRPVQIDELKLISSNVPVDDAPAWVSMATYAVGDLVVYERIIYESLVAGSSAVPPGQGSTSTPRWLLIGPVNRWRMFNKRVGNKWLIGQVTSNNDSIDVTVRPGAVVNSIGIVGVSAATVQIIMTVPGEGEVYNRTFQMIQREPAKNWYEHWFNAFLVQRSVVTFDMPAYGSADIQVIVTNTGGIAKVGTFVIGAMRDLGSAVYGSGLSYNSYSRTDEDEFGNVTIISRGSRRTNEFDIQVKTEEMSDAVRFLDGVRDEPTLYVGTESIEATVVVGWLKSYPVVISNPAFSTMNIEVRSLE